MIIKSFCSVQHTLAHNYTTYQPKDYKRQICFKILGFDVLIDQNLKPWLLEVNYNPSLATSTPLDRWIKQGVVADAFRILNLTPRKRNRGKRKTRSELLKRLTKKSKRKRVTAEEIRSMQRKNEVKKNAQENRNLGNYERIFPMKNPRARDVSYYERFLKYALLHEQSRLGTRSIPP